MKTYSEYIWLLGISQRTCLFFAKFQCSVVPSNSSMSLLSRIMPFYGNLSPYNFWDTYSPLLFSLTNKENDTASNKHLCSYVYSVSFILSIMPGDFCFSCSNGIASRLHSWSTLILSAGHQRYTEKNIGNTFLYQLKPDTVYTRV